MPPSPISSSLNCSLHPDSACILLASLHPVNVSHVNPGPPPPHPAFVPCVQVPMLFKGLSLFPSMRPSLCPCWVSLVLLSILPTLVLHFFPDAIHFIRSMPPSHYLVGCTPPLFPFLLLFSIFVQPPPHETMYYVSVQCCPIIDCMYVQILCFQPILTYLKHLELSPPLSDSLN